MANDLWRTPKEVIQFVERKFGMSISMDFCSTDENKVCEFNLTQDHNFLNDQWLGEFVIDENKLCWCNPPYSNPLPFAEQCAKWAEQCGVHVVMLLNLDTSTRWFELIWNRAHTIMPIIGGRISFINEHGEAVRGNSKPQMLCYFAPYQLPSVRAAWEPVHINDIYLSTNNN